MWRATLKGILAHKVRLALTALAVVLGVGFVAGSYVLTDTMGHAFDGLFAQIDTGVAVVVEGIPKFTDSGPGGGESGLAERVPASVLDRIRQVPGVRVAAGDLSGYAQLVDKHGKAITTGGAPTLGVTWFDDPTLNPLRLREGSPPRGPGQIVVDAATASKYGFHVGDKVKVLLQGPPMEATITGIAGFGESDSLLGATLVAFDPQTAQQALQGNGRWDDIRVAAQPGVSATDLRDRIQRVLPSGYEAKTGSQAAQSSSEDIKKNLSFFNIALLVFAGISLFVAAFTIFNTFSILVAQRTRELALLRALGASTRQVRRSVLVEAVIVGVIASGVGLGFGLVIALGLEGLLKAFGIGLPTTTLQVLPRTIVVALIVGTVTTVVASVVPAYRASRVSPMAALRDQQTGAGGSIRTRVLAGALVTLAGVGALMLGLFGSTSNGASLVGLGAAGVFLGVAMLGPLVARPMAAAIGWPLRRIAGKLGRENAMRNPRRTASTAAALMIGLGLMAFVSIFAASIKASADRTLRETLKADYIVSTSQFVGFSPAVADALRSNPAFSAVEELRQGSFGVNGSGEFLTATDPSTLTRVADVKMLSGSVSALGDRGMLISKKTAEAHDWTVGDVVPAQFARTGRQDLEVAGVYDNNDLLGGYVVSLGTYERNFIQQLDQNVLVTVAPGTTPAAAKQAVTRVAGEFPGVRIQDQAQFRQTTEKQVDQLLGLIVALLGLAVVIALFGIVNTLALSVFERTREIGLLRAVGMARSQVRSMIRWESVITAVFGAVLGVAVGVFFGWAMVQALHDSGVTVLSIPGRQLVLFIVVAALGGMLAAVLPARRAARLNVLEAISTE
ncbi:MAG: ABC transporter permease [Actinomycetota bacterium]|nr:ABC transporter permease [Actinomycetota bacterium]